MRNAPTIPSIRHICPLTSIATKRAPSLPPLVPGRRPRDCSSPVVVDAKQLLADLKRQLRVVEADIRLRLDEERPDRAEDLEVEWRDAGRMAQPLSEWREAEVTQAAVHWILCCVFVRFRSGEGRHRSAPPRRHQPVTQGRSQTSTDLRHLGSPHCPLARRRRRGSEVRGLSAARLAREASPCPLVRRGKCGAGPAGALARCNGLRLILGGERCKARQKRPPRHGSILSKCWASGKSKAITSYLRWSLQVS